MAALSVALETIGGRTELAGAIAIKELLEEQETVWDRFFAAAMTGILANASADPNNGLDYARVATKLANAMMEVRNCR